MYNVCIHFYAYNVLTHTHVGLMQGHCWEHTLDQLAGVLVGRDVLVGGPLLVPLHLHTHMV